MNPTAKKLLEDLRAALAVYDTDIANAKPILRRCISYVQATADPENQPSPVQYYASSRFLAASATPSIR